MSTEPTEETTLPAEQSKTQIAEIAKASILNIEKNKKAYEELRDEATGIVLPEFKDPEFKKTHKKVTELSGRLVKARTAADKLVKQELAIVDEVKTMIKSAGEDLKSITADAEKEIKRLKEAGDTMIEDDKQEKLRQEEEAKQARIAKLYELGFKNQNGYYELGELTITAIQIIQYSEAQFEGLVSQATAAYEAEQLRLAEEAAKEAERLAQEQRDRELEQEAERKEKEALRLASEAKRAELDAAKKLQDEKDAEIAELRALLKAKEVVEPAKEQLIEQLNVINPSAEAYLKQTEAPKLNGTPIKFTEEDRERFLHDVLVGEEAVKSGYAPEFHTTYEVKLAFNDENPYIDTPVGKSTLRIYVEQFLDAAQDGLQPSDVAATGSIGDELLFMVIKGK